MSTDPEFARKAADIVGLYLDPPRNAVVLCVDEKPHIQALERAQGWVRLPNGRALTGFSHHYKRHGTTTLFAALDVATGQVQTGHFRRRRRREFLDFMNEVAGTYPDQELHVVLDNLNTHKPKDDRWLRRRPHVHFHFTPTYASWLDPSGLRQPGLCERLANQKTGTDLPVNGPHGDSGATGRRGRRSSLGDRTFACHACRRIFNARSGTPFNELPYPTDLVLLAVRWRLRDKRSVRDVAELLLPRGVEVTHETIRAWEFRFAPRLADQLRRKRRGKAGVSWYLDETYVKVAGRWGSLYRAIDGDGELLDSMLSEHRDKHAARRFLRRLLEVAGRKPLRVTTDHHPAYRKAIRWILGRKILHRRNQYLNNFTEQDHRAIKQRSYPMLGFGRFESAARFCAAVDELRQDFRVRRRGGPHVPLPDQRRLFLARWHGLITEMATS